MRFTMMAILLILAVALVAGCGGDSGQPPEEGLGGFEQSLDGVTFRSEGTDLILEPLMPWGSSRIALNAAYGAHVTFARAMTRPVTALETARIVFVADGENLFTMAADGTDKRFLYTGQPRGPDWSPVGDWIVFWEEMDDELYKIRPDGTDLTKLTDNSTREEDPCFSPDGSQITFRSNRDESTYEIYVMDADGSNIIRLTDNTAADWDPNWGPTNRIAWVSEQSSTEEDIWVMDPVDADGNNQGDNMFNVTDTGTEQEISPSWAPDGSMIAYEWAEQNDIYKIRPDGTDNTLVLNDTNIQYPDWGGDLDKIVYTQGSWYDLYTIDSDGGTPTQLTETPYQQEFYATWSPSGGTVFASDVRLIGGKTAKFKGTGWSGIIFAQGAHLEQAVAFKANGHSSVEINPLVKSRLSPAVLTVDLKSNGIKLMQKYRGPTKSVRNLIGGKNPIYPFAGAKRLVLSFSVATGELTGVVKLD